jgi:peptide deformylase
MKLAIVDVDQIPKNIEDVSMDDPIEIFKICREMEMLCEAENGIGLSAAQLGLPLKLFVMKSEKFPLVSKDEYGYFVNCDYEATEGEQVVSLEGCLSVRSDDGQLRLFQVDRHTHIRINGYIIFDNLKFSAVDCEVGFNEQSVVLQHEIDHQRNVLISDGGKEIMIW